MVWRWLPRRDSDEKIGIALASVHSIFITKPEIAASLAQRSTPSNL